MPEDAQVPETSRTGMNNTENIIKHLVDEAVLYGSRGGGGKMDRWDSGTRLDRLMDDAIEQLQDPKHLDKLYNDALDEAYSEGRRNALASVLVE